MDSRTQSQQKFLIRAGYYGLIAALIGAGLLALRWVGPFVAGLAIAYVLRPQAIRLARRRGAPESRCAAAGLVFFYLFAALIGGLAGSILCRGVRQLLPHLPALQSRGAAILDRLSARFHAADGLRDALRTVTSRAADAAAGAMETLPGTLVRGGAVVISSFFFAVDFPKISALLLRPFPEHLRRTMRAGARIARVTTLRMARSYGWMLLITFAELTAGLLALRVEGAAALAAWIALIDLLPVLGVGVVLVPWGAAALLNGAVGRGVGLLALFAVIEVVRNVLEPRIVGKSAGLSPLLTLICMTVGLGMFGIVGVFALPVAAVVGRELGRRGMIGK